MVLDTAWHDEASRQAGRAGMRNGGGVPSCDAGNKAMGVFPSCDARGGTGSGTRLFVLRAGVSRYAPFSSARRSSHPMRRMRWSVEDWNS